MSVIIVDTITNQIVTTLRARNMIEAQRKARRFIDVDKAYIAHFNEEPDNS